MRALYQSKDAVEAQLLKDYLAGYRIQTLVHGEFMCGAAGELPVQPFPELWVLEERDFERAKALVEHFLSLDVSGSAWRCASCGELNEAQFHLCWSCSALQQ
ncbi:MAG: DUF2007 domain-containing protein [Gammaproteobacteria bacterium]|nr:DUF2007 domain-containing protein [Gammaproteobacteria bacterium]MCP5417397.1 DUF2007 domain-containing protein [Chromatiaceae bacterium]